MCSTTCPWAVDGGICTGMDWLFAELRCCPRCCPHLAAPTPGPRIGSRVPDTLSSSSSPSPLPIIRPTLIPSPPTLPPTPSSPPAGTDGRGEDDDPKDVHLVAGPWQGPVGHFRRWCELQKHGTVDFRVFLIRCKVNKTEGLPWDCWESWRLHHWDNDSSILGWKQSRSYCPVGSELQVGRETAAGIWGGSRCGMR